MPTTDRDLQALTYLATRLRDETHGCARWDDAGTFANLKDALGGQNLAISIQRVLGHATDPDAKTPGAIKRPFVPEVSKVEPPKPTYDPRKVCHVCGIGKHVHGTEHSFLSVEANRTRTPHPAPAEVRAGIADAPRSRPSSSPGDTTHNPRRA